nr:unnamed protein product [Callosobruchus chinensis]
MQTLSNPSQLAVSAYAIGHAKAPSSVHLQS